MSADTAKLVQLANQAYCASKNSGVSIYLESLIEAIQALAYKIDSEAKK